MAQAFVHLHTHSEYSFVDGSIRIPALVETAKKMGHSHIALTDHCNMHGAVEFFFKAKEAGLTPIIGCEIYVWALSPQTEKKVHQLVLLAQNTQGYKNLLKIVSSAYLGENFSKVPVVPWQSLADHGKDLIALSSFNNGEFATLVNKLEIEPIPSSQDPVLHELKYYAEAMKKYFPDDNFYIEITDNDLAGQKEQVRKQVAYARLLNLPIVASANAHYLSKDFSDTHSLAVAIKNSLTLADLRRRLRNAQFHLMNDEEMEERFRDYPEALHNTLVIAERCSFVEIETGNYYLPKIKLSEGEAADLTLKRMAHEGLERRLEKLSPLYGDGFDETKKKTYRDRLNYELDVITKMGFHDYFLIVQDFIRWAKEQGIPVGPGRGSGAGSLVAYALLITDLDPIPYNLIFERFLNPERISMPDFDIDFCQWRREEVIQYCISKYGKKNVAQITTFGKMNAKAAFKSVGRCMNLSFNRVDQFTKLFPNDLGITLQQALDQEPRIRQEMAKDDELRECMEQALKLEGLCSHTSVHAAGVVMSDGDMTNYVPIYTTDGSSYITQYEMKPTEKVGLVKFDFLGLKTLTVIDKAVKLIHQQVDPTFAIDKIPLNDQKVYALISQGHTVGIFQCESSGITQLIRKLKPSTFEDLFALVALFRPGPLGSGMVDDFVKRKHGQQRISYPLPSLEPILKDTYGLILYQEQVQSIAAFLAGYTLGEADLLRKAMGKKIPEEMARQKQRFLSGAEKNQVPLDKAEEIFELMAEFAKYGFNKSHSAAYGLISYQTAYLKYHFPEYYLAACMTCDMDHTEKLVKYAEECRRLSIHLMTPNINHGCLEFTVPSKRKMDFALCAIKGLGAGSIVPLIEERDKNGPFLNLTDLATRVHLGRFGKKNLQLLIASGGLDELGYKRKTLDSLVTQLVDYSIKHHEASSSGQRGLFELAPKSQSGSEDWLHKQKYPLLKKDQKAWDLDDLFLEKKLLGTFITEHPLRLFPFDAQAFTGIRMSEFEKMSDGKHTKVKVGVFALLTKVEYRRSKRGSMIAYVRLEQDDCMHEAMMFSSALEGVKLPDNNSLVFAEGALEKFNEESPLRFNIEKLTDIQNIRRERLRMITLHMTLPEEKTGRETVLRLKKVVALFPGETMIKILMKSKNAQIKIETPAWKVSPSNEFLFQTTRIPSVSLEYSINS